MKPEKLYTIDKIAVVAGAVDAITTVSEGDCGLKTKELYCNG